MIFEHNDTLFLNVQLQFTCTEECSDEWKSSASHSIPTFCSFFLLCWISFAISSEATLLNEYQVNIDVLYAVRFYFVFFFLNTRRKRKSKLWRVGICVVNSFQNFFCCWTRAIVISSIGSITIIVRRYCFSFLENTIFNFNEHKNSEKETFPANLWKT